jgi:hypothetical protein
LENDCNRPKLIFASPVAIFAEATIRDPFLTQILPTAVVGTAAQV